jgi:hypothetical protein
MYAGSAVVSHVFALVADDGVTRTNPPPGVSASRRQPEPGPFQQAVPEQNAGLPSSCDGALWVAPCASMTKAVGPQTLNVFGAYRRYWRVPSMQVLLSPGASGIAQSMLGVMTLVHDAEASGAAMLPPSVATPLSPVVPLLPEPAEPTDPDWAPELPEVVAELLPAVPDEAALPPPLLALPPEPDAARPASFPTADVEPQPIARYVTGPIWAIATTCRTTKLTICRRAMTFRSPI